MKKTHSIPFILSSKEKSIIPFLNSVINNIDNEVIAELDILANDDEFGQDLSNIFFYFLENFTEEDIPIFQLLLETNLQKSLVDFPEIRSIEKMKIFFSIIAKI